MFSNISSSDSIDNSNIIEAISEITKNVKNK